jgi:N-acetylglucosamine malate deacetylase 1
VDSYRKLIISPHIDDEILGCGGIIDRNTFILECGVDDFHVVSRDERIDELKKAQAIAGFQLCILKHRVNHYQIELLIDDLSAVINDYKPDVVFIPYQSYNQDHQVVNKASLIALRHHDINFFVKKVLIYEEPDMVQWDHSTGYSFKPNYFTEIDIEKKIQLYECLKSQNRSFRSCDFLRTIAALRGQQAMCQYAEGYSILRWIE